MNDQIKELFDTLCFNYDFPEEFAAGLAEFLYEEGCKKVPKGKWLYYSDERISGWLCNCCKKYSTGKRYYCPECGARMGGID